jgi:hypothetical protein
MAESDPHKWLIRILEAESSKVEALIPEGAEQFYLITNVPGTAHLHSGAIDKVNAILRESVSVPAQCLWRDDLNRRLDNAWDLKWTYPELMTGIDMLHLVIESRLSADQERRTAAIRAFVRNQYRIDQEVRFKQVELQNSLLDLFIDVPIALRNAPTERGGKRRLGRALRILAQSDVVSKEPEISTELTGLPEDFEELQVLRNMGAATLLLHPAIQADVPQLVLEGAPGQGKSTITQYVCQVHRMRVLGEQKTLERLPESHKATGVRVPFRVDLRDLATWIGGRNPFSGGTSENISVPPSPSLEAFLAAQVGHHSGGFDFTVADLHAVAKLSSLLLVFDGLDEVADITRREEVVAEVIAGVARLKESASSLQVIVTSRPAAFANSPGFPEDSFPHFELVSITRTLIDDYANKWLRVRKVPDREASEFRQILKDKLDQPHLRDLARNPMQLAILLSLIHTRGASLPDKRTALYTNYVDLFFNREAEKSSVVRDHRDLLVDIHGYLAWVLHSEAEEGNHSGSISADALQALLREYLCRECQDQSLVSRLFHGMIERVVFLVARVQGMLEFEVQPLREYFCARYLYETAPYSPPGSERRGTRPDRFDAIARNFYWLNVTRFYAGFYSKGELPSLIERLGELKSQSGYKHIAHPRILAAMLLADWVFAQNPKSVREAVSLILDDIGLRYVATTRSRRSGSAGPMILPRRSGKEELIQRCFELLNSRPHDDYALELIDLVKMNEELELVHRLWSEQVASARGAERTQWMRYGLMLGLLPLMNSSELDRLMSDDPLNFSRLDLLFDAKQMQYLERSEGRCRVIIDSLLDGEMYIGPNQRPTSTLDSFASSIQARGYASAFHNPEPLPLSEVWSSRRGYSGFELAEGSSAGSASDHVLEECKEIIEVARTEQARTAKEWASEIDPWERIVEHARTKWGERWSLYVLANTAAGVTEQLGRDSNYSDLLDSSKSLCRRTQSARSRAGASAWWKEQLQAATTEQDRMFVSLVLLTWATARVLVIVSADLDSALTDLSTTNFGKMLTSARGAAFIARPRASNYGLLKLDVSALPQGLSARTLAALGSRASDPSAARLYAERLSVYDGHDREVLVFCQHEALSQLILDPRADDSGPADWQKHLDMVARSYSRGIGEIPYWYYLRGGNRRVVSAEVAEEVAEHPDRYPSHLVTLAESRCRQTVADGIEPVIRIAQKESWFEL